MEANPSSPSAPAPRRVMTSPFKLMMAFSPLAFTAIAPAAPPASELDPEVLISPKVIKCPDTVTSPPLGPLIPVAAPPLVSIPSTSTVRLLPVEIFTTPPFLPATPAVLIKDATKLLVSDLKEETKKSIPSALKSVVEYSSKAPNRPLDPFPTSAPKVTSSAVIRRALRVLACENTAPENETSPRAAEPSGELL